MINITNAQEYETESNKILNLIDRDFEKSKEIIFRHNNAVELYQLDKAIVTTLRDGFDHVNNGNFDLANDHIDDCLNILVPRYQGALNKSLNDSHCSFMTRYPAQSFNDLKRRIDLSNCSKDNFKVNVNLINNKITLVIFNTTKDKIYSGSYDVEDLTNNFPDGSINFVVGFNDLFDVLNSIEIEGLFWFIPESNKELFLEYLVWDIPTFKRISFV